MNRKLLGIGLVIVILTAVSVSVGFLLLRSNPPQAEITIVAVRGLTVSFLASSLTGAGLLYEWDFGDGSKHVSGSEVTHTYLTAGTYTVRLSAQNWQDSSIITKTIEVELDPLVLGVAVSQNGGNWQILFLTTPEMAQWQITLVVLSAGGGLLSVVRLDISYGKYIPVSESGWIAPGDVILLDQTKFPAGSTFQLIKCHGRYEDSSCPPVILVEGILQ